MTYEELNNFTYGELQYFTYADLSLDKYELIAKAENQSIILPKDVQEKLRSLCTELAQKCPEQKHLFENFSFHKISDALSFLVNMAKLHQILHDTGSYAMLRDAIQNLFDFLLKNSPH